MVNATTRPLYSRERPDTHRVGGWVGPRVGLDGCGKSRPLHRDSIPETSNPLQVACWTSVRLVLCARIAERQPFKVVVSSMSDKDCVYQVFRRNYKTETASSSEPFPKHARNYAISHKGRPQPCGGVIFFQKQNTPTNCPSAFPLSLWCSFGHPPQTGQCLARACL